LSSVAQAAGVEDRRSTGGVVVVRIQSGAFRV